MARLVQHQVNADGIGIGRNATPMFNITINNYGTISGSDNSICNGKFF